MQTPNKYDGIWHAQEPLHSCHWPIATEGSDGQWFLTIEKTIYFPDFVIRNLIIETTAWRHPSLLKLQKLRNRIKKE